MPGKKSTDVAQIQLLIFDLDGTLWDSTPALVKAEQELYDWLNQNWPGVTRKYNRKRWRIMGLELRKRYPDISHDVTKLRKMALSNAALEAGYYDKAQIIAEEGFRIFLHWRNKVHIYPDTLPALHALSQQFTLGSLTNGNANLGTIGMRDWFHVNLDPVMLGAAKPDAICFQAACSYAGVAPSEAFHIGDDPLCDVSGAKEAGLGAIWINRQKNRYTGSHPPDAEFDNLEPLIRFFMAG